ncbi:hypothetical protein B7P33_18785 [Sediminicola luteus]|uniref:HTH araC/xylS-type domain-containing protein n=1 Tax=Sediminicola luteus TaxID=319238 RepID=A0A2A4G133_9FLAO|nr:hypothetical protein B7P33_18785 [Sediminicola luteus]
MSKRRFKVALLMETSNAYSRGVIKGIYGYIMEHDQWDVYLGEYSRGEPNPDWLLSWDGDGIIARIENETIAELIKRCQLPTIDVSSANLIPGIPWVETDDRKIAQLAFEHLKDCGLKHFAFAGSQFNWSKWRADHFKEVLEGQGVRCDYYSLPMHLDYHVVDEQKKIESWLATLPKPIGIFAAYDQLGRLIIDCSQKMGFMVPEEIAVIGVDNDPLICELCSPPLTSVIPDTFKTGYLAAELLAALMQGKTEVNITNLMAPIGVKKRRSTDSLAIEDPHISKALHYIYENASIGSFSINDILAIVPMTRRVFEKRFLEMVGHTPYKEAQRIRVARIQELLTESDLGLLEIAEKMGFEHVSYMSFLFKRETGISPIAYRHKMRKEFG